MSYLCSLDIANRVCQHLGVPAIRDVDEDSVANTEVAFAYDKVRRAELRRNTWRFAIRDVILRPVDTGTKLLIPKAWDEAVNYPRYSIVADENEELWVSKIPDNLGNEPGQTGAWDQYFGPMTATEWDEDLEYFAGELVYQTVGSGGKYVVYMSLTNSNDDEPDTADAYAATTTYKIGDVVSYGGSQWRSLIEFNTAHTPASPPLDWDSTAIYAAGETVTGSDGFIYSSIGSGNTGYDPVITPGAWTNTGNPAAWKKEPDIHPSATSWLPIYAALEELTFAYPIGTGPSSQTGSRNIFRLPSGFLRRAPRFPKAGANPYLGAPSALVYDDRDFQGEYIISGEGGPVVFRFVADHVDVRTMDDMFSEGLACRIALACCEKITQSTSKLGGIASLYKEFMGDARRTNAIEIGPEEPEEDDYVTCRL